MESTWIEFAERLGLRRAEDAEILATLGLLAHNLLGNEVFL